MSNEAGNNNGDHHEPLRKRQKRGDGSDGNDEEMYDEATARKMLKEVVLVPEDNEYGEEAVIGFDPDDAALDNIYDIYNAHWGRQLKMTLMIYFARKGDLKMCRYLVSRGASTTKMALNSSPMHVAASHGNLAIVDHGVATFDVLDVTRVVDSGTVDHRVGGNVVGVEDPF